MREVGGEVVRPGIDDFETPLRDEAREILELKGGDKVDF